MKIRQTLLAVTAATLLAGAAGAGDLVRQPDPDRSRSGHYRDRDDDQYRDDRDGDRRDDAGRRQDWRSDHRHDDRHWRGDDWWYHNRHYDRHWRHFPPAYYRSDWGYRAGYEAGWREAIDSCSFGYRLGRYAMPFYYGGYYSYRAGYEAAWHEASFSCRFGQRYGHWRRGYDGFWSFSLVFED